LQIHLNQFVKSSIATISGFTENYLLFSSCLYRIHDNKFIQFVRTEFELIKQDINLIIKRIQLYSDYTIRRIIRIAQ